MKETQSYFLVKMELWDVMSLMVNNCMTRVDNKQWRPWVGDDVGRSREQARKDEKWCEDVADFVR